eukprot:scaffold226481_cov36-Prasinocladus_malaysianus.AAC.1
MKDSKLFALVIALPREFGTENIADNIANRHPTALLVVCYMMFAFSCYRNKLSIYHTESIHHIAD